MTDVSHGSQKVNDFLSSLSKLSQDRLDEDQKINRGLSRDVDSLKGNHSRSDYMTQTQFDDEYVSIKPPRPEIPPKLPRRREEDGPKLPRRREEDGPKLPRRREEEEDGPKLPRRREEEEDGPKLPRRREEEEDGPKLPARKEDIGPELPMRRNNKPSKPPKPVNEQEFTIDLINPIGSSESVAKYGNKYTEKTEQVYAHNQFGKRDYKENTEKTYRSFMEVENSIKADNKPPKPIKLNHLSSTSQSPKPIPFAKPTSLTASTTENTKTTNFNRNVVNSDSVSTDQNVNKPKPLVPKKPISVITEKPKVNPYDGFKNQDNEFLITQLAKLKTSKPPPPKPSKEFTKYDNKDTNNIKSRLATLSPTKTIDKHETFEAEKSIKRFASKDNELLNEQLNKLKNPPVKPKPVVKSKPVTRTKPVVQSKPVTRTKPEIKSKPADFKPDTKPKSELSPASQIKLNEIDFKSRLSSIMRTNSEPPNQSQAPVLIRRSETDPIKREDTETKGNLVHANKTRSKGPKRRLPKNLNKEITKVEPKKPPPLKPKPKHVGEVFI